MNVRANAIAGIRESLDKVESFLGAAACPGSTSCAVFTPNPWDGGNTFTEEQRAQIRLYVESWIAEPLRAAVASIDGKATAEEEAHLRYLQTQRANLDKREEAARMDANLYAPETLEAMTTANLEAHLRLAECYSAETQRELSPAIEQVRAELAKRRIKAAGSSEEAANAIGDAAGIPTSTRDGLPLTAAQRATAAKVNEHLEGSSRTLWSVRLAQHGTAGDVLAVFTCDDDPSDNPCVAIWHLGSAHVVRSAEDFERWHALLPHREITCQRRDDLAFVLAAGGTFAEV